MMCTLFVCFIVAFIVPISFIYVQLPDQPEPKTLWPMVKWQDVTSAYAGLFFRAEGGEAASFGQVQKDNAPRVTEIRYKWWNSWSNPLPGWNSSISQMNIGEENAVKKGYGIFEMYLTMSSGEVRPRNMAIRIWKRSG